jgi:hypothetical protein
MQAPSPWVFATIGTAMTVAAAVLTHFAAAKQDRQRKDIESKIAEIDKKIAGGLQYYLLSRSTFDFVKVFEFIEQSIHIMLLPQHSAIPTSRQQALSVIDDTVIGRRLRGFIELYRAATGSPCTQQQVNDWPVAIQRERVGHQSSQPTLAQQEVQLSNDYLNANNALADERAKLSTMRRDLDLRADTIRYIGTAVQIVGVIIVLLKDLPLRE